MSQSPRCETSLPHARRRNVADAGAGGRAGRRRARAREPSPVVTATIRPTIPIPIRMSPIEKTFVEREARREREDVAEPGRGGRRRCCTFDVASPASRPAASQRARATGIWPPFATIAAAVQRHAEREREEREVPRVREREDEEERVAREVDRRLERGSRARWKKRSSWSPSAAKTAQLVRGTRSRAGARACPPRMRAKMTPRRMLGSRNMEAIGDGRAL